MNAPVSLLLIDDNPTDRLLASRELQRALPAVQVTEVITADDLRVALDRGAFHAVVTDYQLRWTDGLSVLRQVKARYADCPVLMFTNTGTEEIAVEAMKSGLDDYIIKAPDHYVRLPMALRSALDRAAAQRRVDQAEARQRLLAEVSAALSQSLDVQTTLATLARLVVPLLADWCVIDVPGEHGDLVRAASVHRDPAKTTLLANLRWPASADQEQTCPLWRVLRTGRADCVTVETEQDLSMFADRPADRDLLRALGFASWMGLPLTARGHTLGVLTLVAATSRPPYTPTDLGVAAELAGRGALALDNARLYQQAQDAIRSRDAFLSIAAHELKTPLTTMVGYAEVLKRRIAREQIGDARLKRAVEAIVGQGERLQALVEELLDVSRLQSDLFNLERRPIDLRDLVQQVVGNFQPALDQRALHVEMPVGPLIVEGDPQQLEHVLVNLLQNAVKYSPGGEQISVSLASHKGLACVSVEDRGIGIPAEALGRLFQRFFRASNAAAYNISGFGIGLYLANEIVTRHNGTITVHSVEGSGSTFTVCLPLLEA